MDCKYLLAILLLVLFPGMVQTGLSQNADSLFASQSNSPLKIGMALSGGGAKGFAHIGVLKVFEEEGIPIHMVTGSSIGAVVGSLYAVGYSPDEIKEIALQTDWVKLFDDNYQFNPQNFSNSVSGKDTYLFTFPFHDNKLQLPLALTDGQNVSMMLYRLMLPYHDVEDFSNLPIPFACIATNLATGEAHLFDQGYLPDAVRASFAIPSFFNPVTIDGQSYIDGSISRSIPAEDLRNMGADIVIATDVGEPVKPVDSLFTFVHILRQAVGYRQLESDQRQIEIADFYIQPDVQDYNSFSYDRINRLIEIGETAARHALPRLKEYLKSHPTANPAEKQPPISREDDTIHVTDVRLNNVEGRLARLTGITLGILPPTTLTVGEIERKIKMLHNTGLFSQISYRLLDDGASSGKRLILSFQTKDHEYAGFSARYDSKYKAALLFGVSLNDNLVWADHLESRLRVGDVLELSADYSAPITLAPLSQFHMAVGVRRTPIDYYVDGEAISTIGLEQLSLSPSLSLELLRNLRFQAGTELEFYNLNEAVGNTLVFENTSFLLNGFGRLSYHTLNRPYFPTSGQSMNVKTTLSTGMWGSSSEFLQVSGNWISSVKLWQDFNFNNTFLAGYTSASSLPLHYHFYLGGAVHNPVYPSHQFAFWGYDTQELRNTNLMALRSNLQYRVNNNFFITGGWNVAHLADHWTFNIDKDRLWQGFSLSAGALTVVGPVEVTLSSPDLKTGYTLKINVGYSF